MSNVPAFWSGLPDAKAGAHYTHSERPLKAIRKIVVKGSVDVYFRRFNTPQLVVAGETQDAVDAIKTYFKGDKLIVENEGTSFQCGGVHFSTGKGAIHIGSFGEGVHININGQNIHISGNANRGGHGRAVVGVALPEIQAVKIKGSGDITLLDLKQAGIELEIEGSGDITAFGQVDSLEVSIAGSGDVDASELIANRGLLSIAGSGDIRAHLSQAVTARIAGSGDIVVRGNPPQRSKQIAGSGSVKFK
jgi:hypothetical protein